MSTYLRLFRIQNLIFIAFIQLVMQQIVLVPILQTFGFDPVFNSAMLGLLITGSVLIAAGGYVLNDYFDVKIDAINRPDKLVVGNFISRRTALLLHQVLTWFGVICGLILAYVARSFTLGFIFIVVPGLLWFYSTSYKRQFIIGNVVIAFNAALVVLIVGITQLAFLKKEFGNLIFETPIPMHFYSWIGGFAAFSFLCTWIREIIKDIEDEPGDRELECRTMPIKWGMTKTKIFLYCLMSIVVVALFVVNELFIPFPGTLTFRYITFGIALPLAILAYLVYMAKTPADYHQASGFMKIIMLTGVSYSFVFYYLQAKNHGISIFNLFNVI